ncbi:unnamed protein product [Spodoptera littoralis]|uniref:Vitellogenin domain-containing protein n=1 Tax=Spodoptera littoralis TaxID=7109 RepID=A0A9N8Q3A2_SPOLI|nr:unnamed protein product [Spodoptera littoralis]CAD0230282.1 unnamed protein product [Spodoptera littoralis]
MGVGVWRAVVLCALVGLVGLPGLAGLQPEPRPWRALGAAAAFRLETTLQLNDAARTSKEVGYKLRARLLLRPRWARDSSEYLLEFQLLSPKLYLRGKNVNADFMPYSSVWDTVGDTTFYAHWSHGLIKEAYLNPDELTDVANYQKAIISLFQFQMLSGEHNETDVSGSCDVLYESISEDVFRKIKQRRCLGDEEAGVVSARRLARYSLSGERLGALHAEELLALGHAQLGLKLRSWHSLQADGAAPAPAPAAGLAAALALLPAGLRAEPLGLRPAPGDEDEVEELGELVQRWAGALADDAAGAGGDAAGPRAALQLLPALRRAPRAALQALLRAQAAQPALPGLLRLLALAGARAAVQAAAAELQLAARELPLEPARVFLAAFGAADDPEEGAVLAVLRLADDARHPAVAAAALLAAAAAAARQPAAAPVVRDAALRGLARCRDPECRAPRLLALGNLRAPAADVLLQHAERADAAAPAALWALQAAPAAALTDAHLERLARLALRRDVPLDVRAAALELLVRRRAELPAALVPVAGALYVERGAAAHELRRVLWGRAATLPPLRALPAMLSGALAGWDAAAPAGSSSVLQRAPGWACGGWHAELLALQVAAGGLLRRGAVQLQALDPANRTHEVLSIEVWTRGLEAFSGGNTDGAEPDASAEPEEPAAGLALSVAGARLPDVQLFQGQAELLGHVWAATASAPTPVLRALWARGRAGRLALQAGLWARGRAGAAASLALDAHATLSLWTRSARAALALRAAVAAEARVSVRGWARLAGAARAELAPRLRVGADLDFYSGVALCVRAAAAPLRVRRRSALRSDWAGAGAGAGARGARLRVLRGRAEVTRVPGRTLSLGRPNDVTCRTLLSADEDEAEAEAAEEADDEDDSDDNLLAPL